MSDGGLLFFWDYLHSNMERINDVKEWESSIHLSSPFSEQVSSCNHVFLRYISGGDLLNNYSNCRPWVLDEINQIALSHGEKEQSLGELVALSMWKSPERVALFMIKVLSIRTYLTLRTRVDLPSRNRSWKQSSFHNSIRDQKSFFIFSLTFFLKTHNSSKFFFTYSC